MSDEVARLRAALERAQQDSVRLRAALEERTRQHEAALDAIEKAQDDIGRLRVWHERALEERDRITALHKELLKMHTPTTCYVGLDRAGLEAYCDSLAVGKARAEEERDAAREALRDALDELGSNKGWMSEYYGAPPHEAQDYIAALRKQGGIDG